MPYVMSPTSRQRILTVTESDEMLRPDDIVLGLVYGNEVRAYPRDAIARPHYFTDTLGNTPLMISYCILCNSGVAFKSELDGRQLELKCVTAYNNNIIYYESATGNFIQQLVSRARDLSGSVARHLSGCHSAPKGVRNDADASATGDTEDEIRGSV